MRSRPRWQWRRPSPRFTRTWPSWAATAFGSSVSNLGVCARSSPPGAPAPMRGANSTASTRRSPLAARSRRSLRPARLRVGCSRSRQPGRMGLGDLLAPAIAQAKEGASVTKSQARLTAQNLSELEHVPGFAHVFLLNGKAPNAGAILKQTALAATLEHLAHTGLDDFYRGDVGRELAGDLDRIGSPLTRSDLERCRASLAEPLSVTIEDDTLFSTPPPTQGLASLIILALFERLRVPRGEGFDHVHGLVEATKRAFAVRDRVITDPDRLPH